MTPPLASQIPFVLVEKPNWIGWYKVPKPGKPSWDFDKKPCDAVTGIETGWPNAGRPFEEARQGVIDKGLDGISFIPKKEHKLVFMDFDECRNRDTGEIDPVVDGYRKFFTDAYWEVTPSGTGVRGIMRGTLTKNLSVPHPVPDSTFGASVEIYDSKHHLTVTGNSLADSSLEIGENDFGIRKVLQFIHFDDKEEVHESRPMRLGAIRERHAKNLETLRLAPSGYRWKQLYATTAFAAQAYAAEALEGKDSEIKDRIWQALCEAYRPAKPDQRYERTHDEAWANGLKQPLRITGSEKERADALQRIEELIADDSATFDLEQVLCDAAQLSTAEYDVIRKKLASRLGFTRPTVFDAEVAKRRPKDEDGEVFQGTAINIVDDEPWSSAVDGAKLLQEISDTYKKYVYFPKPSDADAAALFTVGTHCFNNFAIFPFLGISAVGENSGKTTLSKCVKRLAYRPIPTNNVTPAALFRLIEMYHGTIFIDEMDTFLKPDSELYGILNSGHDAEMAYVIRTVGDDHNPRNFSTWCPKCWCMLGKPKRTVTSRSIVIELLRKPKTEKLDRLPRIEAAGEEWKRLRRQCTRWCADNKDVMLNTKVEVEGLLNRAEDNWEPLFLIAKLAGGDWIERVKAAAGVAVVQQENLNIVLLRDVRNIFFSRQRQLKLNEAPALARDTLVNDLCCQTESPWPHYDHHQPITTNQLVGLLGDFGIRPEPYWDAKVRKTRRGFTYKKFEALFKSYLADEEPQETTLSQY